MLLFLAGIFISFIGSLPPGLISVSVAQTAVQRTVEAALWVGFGAALTEFFQAWAAVGAASFLLANPLVSQVFQWLSVPVFLGLGLYWLWQPPASPRVEGGAIAGAGAAVLLLRGVALSVFNLVVIPFWLTYAAWLRMQGLWRDGLPYTLLFCAGVTVGTMLAFFLYARGARRLLERSDLMARYTNRVVAVVFLGLGGMAIWRLVL